MLLTPYFTDLFLTLSSARPRLVVGLKGLHDVDWCFFSSTQPHNKYEKSFVATVDFHGYMKKFPGIKYIVPESCGHAADLIHYIQYNHGSDILYSPSTGQYTRLPKGIWYRRRGFLRFDPIDKQFKVLSISSSSSDQESADILTYGNGYYTWRKIHWPLNHFPKISPIGGICIDGVLYYFSTKTNAMPFMLVCFDVKSEIFEVIETDFFCGDRHKTKLVNYKGKIGVITSHCNCSCLELCVWVLMDVEREEWSKLYEYTFRENRVVESNYSSYWEDQVVRNYVSVVGVTARGKIVLSKRYREASKPLYVFYFNPERNNRQIVEIQGFEGFEKKFAAVQVFVDYVASKVETDLRFIDMLKTLNAVASSMIKPPEHKCETTSTSSRVLL